MTLPEFIKVLEACDRGEAPAINYALHNFIHYLLEYANKHGETSIDMLRIVEGTEPNEDK